MAGELVIRKGGYLAIEDANWEAASEQGKSQLFTEKTEDCCCCNPCENSDPKPYKILYSWTSRRDYVAANLSPYKKRGECFKYWKIAEGTMYFDEHGCFTGSSGSGYQSGAIENSELIGLPSSWQSSYSYEGYVKLLVFCCYG